MAHRRSSARPDAPVAIITEGITMSFPAQPSGTVTLYADNNWTSTSHTIALSALAKDYRHDLPKTMQDRATWIAFNLPVGTVATLTDEVTDVRQGPIADLMRHTGRLVDLIGTGKTESVDLTTCNMNDCASTFMWRTPNMRGGMVELFEKINYEGNRTVIFPSEWPMYDGNNAHSMAGWYIDARTSSAKFNKILEGFTFRLVARLDAVSDEKKGYLISEGSREVPDFRPVTTEARHGLNDCVAGFAWMKKLKPRDTFGRNPEWQNK
jgi:hypothetical protein